MKTPKPKLNLGNVKSPKKATMKQSGAAKIPSKKKGGSDKMTKMC